MPGLNLNQNASEGIVQTGEVFTTGQEQNDDCYISEATDPVIDVNPDMPIASNTRGLNEHELNDANKITVTIADRETPLIILFGPPSCGKTMTLIRITRFLRTKGYTVSPVTSFRPSYDDNYKQMCEAFDEMINNEEAAKSTSRINFMLVKVSKNGRPVCQILEGPGEYYFYPEKPNAEFPKYVHTIISSNNRKIWTIMVEPDNTNPRMDVSARNAYVNKIHKLKREIGPRDKVVFLFNKVDGTDYVISPGVVNEKQVMKETNDLYPGIFEPFMNDLPIIKFFKPYKFDFVPFQTGSYNSANDDTLMFTNGYDEYPLKLWNVYLSRING